MSFTSYIPCIELLPFVKSFAITKAETEETYGVLPDTGIVIGFQYSGRLSYIENNTEVALSHSGITGLRDHVRIFRNGQHTNTLLVFFNPGGAATFFRFPLHELFQQSVSLDHLMLRSELMVLEEQLCEAKKDTDRIAVMEHFLLNRKRQETPDQLIMAAISLIYQYKGNIRIRDLATQLHTSHSPLEKRFRQLVGASPKKFASIVRFHYLLSQHEKQDSLTGVAYEAGFYDQPHFIKEFKRFTGETPKEFFFRSSR